MPDPIVDDPEFEPADVLLEEVMALLPAPVAVPRATGRVWLAAALLLLGCLAVAGAALLQGDGGAASAVVQEPQAGAADKAEYLQLLDKLQGIAITSQHIEGFDATGNATLAQDPQPRLEIAAAEIGRWRRWLAEAAGHAKEPKTEDVVSLVLHLDLGSGRVVEVIARVDDGTLVTGPLELALRGEFQRELQVRKDELLRKRRVLEGKAADPAELEALSASAMVVECRAAPVAQLEPRLLRFRQLQCLTLLPGQGTPDRATLASLAKLPALAELHLYAGNLGGDDLSVLAQLPQLRRLVLWQANKVTGTGLRDVKQLRSLWLGEAALDTAGMRALASLPRLTELALGGQIDPAVCAGLPTLPMLKQLRLIGSYGDDCLPHVLLTKVEALQLSGKFTGAGLRTLVGLPSLKELGLGGCPLRDEDLEGIGALRSLQRLDLRSTLITKAGLDSLRESLPKCELLAAPGVIFQQWVHPSDDVDDTWLRAHWTPLPAGWLLAGAR